jgi:hypothetical protein
MTKNAHFAKKYPGQEREFLAKVIFGCVRRKMNKFVSNLWLNLLVKTKEQNKFCLAKSEQHGKYFPAE